MANLLPNSITACARGSALVACGRGTHQSLHGTIITADLHFPWGKEAPPDELFEQAFVLGSFWFISASGRWNRSGRMGLSTEQGSVFAARQRGFGSGASALPPRWFLFIFPLIFCRLKGKGAQDVIYSFAQMQLSTFQQREILRFITFSPSVCFRAPPAF